MIGVLVQYDVRIRIKVSVRFGLCFMFGLTCQFSTGTIVAGANVIEPTGNMVTISCYRFVLKI